MRNEPQIDNQTASEQNAQNVNTCPNCGTLMPPELRFCRACGCRLGEGVEEYTETVRLDGASSTARAKKSKTARRAFSQTSSSLKDWGASGKRTGETAVKTLTGGLKPWSLARACSRMPRWMFWVFIPILLVMLADGFSSKSITIRRNRARAAASTSAPSSFLGSHYVTAQGGGAFIQDVTPPNSAADKAGLIGGDVITSFDGKPVRSDSDLTDVLTATPAGKTVDVIFTRDGETKTVKLTTISEEENGRLEEAFEKRREGMGRLGIDDDDAEIVKVDGTTISGVRLDDISANLPADMAGIREGDVVIQFDQTPIRTVRELVTRIRRAVPYSVVNVVVMREGQRLEIPVKVGRR